MMIGPVVGPDDGSRPDARARSDADFADEHRFGVDVGIRVNPRPFVADRIEGHGAILSDAAHRIPARGGAAAASRRHGMTAGLWRKSA